MPEFRREEKRVGLHSAVFLPATLQVNGLTVALSRKTAGAAKVRLDYLLSRGDA
jgi:hypothetical protein